MRIPKPPFKYGVIEMINSFCWSRSGSGSIFESRHRSGAWSGDWSISLLQIGQKIMSRSWK
jgi:hypothetical protein